jgi:hypothetical protein
MIIIAYVLGLAWLGWWAYWGSGTWREAAALLVAPVLPTCAVALLLGSLPWILFIPFAHMTALVFLPIYWVLRRAGRVRPAFPVLTGALAGVVTAFALRGWWIPGNREVLEFGALGAISGLLFWVIAFFRSTGGRELA